MYVPSVFIVGELEEQEASTADSSIKEKRIKTSLNFLPVYGVVVQNNSKP